MDSKTCRAVVYDSPRRCTGADAPQQLNGPQANPHEGHLRDAITRKIKPLDQIAVQKLDTNGRWYVVPCEQIAYVFLASTSTFRFIHTAWLSDLRSETGNVLIRTTRGLTLRTDFRRFSEIEGRLDERQFVLLNRALIGNARRITEVDLCGKQKQIGIAVNNDTEWLSVSRRALCVLLPRLGFRHR